MPIAQRRAKCALDPVAATGKIERRGKRLLCGLPDLDRRWLVPMWRDQPLIAVRSGTPPARPSKARLRRQCRTADNALVLTGPLPEALGKQHVDRGLAAHPTMLASFHGNPR